MVQLVLHLVVTLHVHRELRRGSVAGTFHFLVGRKRSIVVLWFGRSWLSWSLRSRGVIFRKNGRRLQVIVESHVSLTVSESMRQANTDEVERVEETAKWHQEHQQKADQELLGSDGVLGTRQEVDGQRRQENG